MSSSAEIFQFPAAFSSVTLYWLSHSCFFFIPGIFKLLLASSQPAANKNRPWGGDTGDISRPDEVWNQSCKWATIFISLSLLQKTSQPPRSSTRRSPSFSPKQKSGDSSILRGHWGDRIQSPSVVEKRHQTTTISHNVALGLQGMVSGWWFLNKI